MSYTGEPEINCKFKSGPVVLVSKEISFIFPLSYAYLAGYLRQKGEDVIILYKHPNDYNGLIKRILSLNPILVGFGSLYPELKEISTIIRMLNNAGRQFPVVIGGQMVTPLPEFAVKVTGADFGVIGEGEIILCELVKALRGGLDIYSVKGLIIKQGEKLLSTGPGEFIRDLSKLPGIPYDLFPQEDWLFLGRWYARYMPVPQWRFDDRVVAIHGGRGCPFNCNFCYHHSNPRFRPIPLMMAEADEAIGRFNANMLNFSDDLAFGSLGRARELANGIKGLREPVNFKLSTRFDVLNRIDDNLLYELKEAGCRTMGLGIESGSDRILKLIGKNCTATEILNSLDRLKKVGILPICGVMVGHHTETIEDVEDSIKLVREAVRNDPNFRATFTIVTPFPGSQLYDIIFQKGYLSDHQEYYDRYFSTSDIFQTIVNLSEMYDKEILEMYRKLESTYLEEGKKALSTKIKIIYKLQRCLGRADHILNNRLIPKLPKLNIIHALLGIFSRIYEYSQLKLEHIHLKLRGLM